MRREPLDLDGISELAYGLSLIERGDPFSVDYDHMGDLLAFSRKYLEREAHPQAKADARALWAVRVLDAWRRRGIGRGWRMTEGLQTSAPMCDITCDSRAPGGFSGADEDAARHGAAMAIYPNLDEAVRRELGECPT